MKRIALIIPAISFWLISYPQDVVKWNFSTKKISEKIYEIHITPTVQNNWHIYSQTSPEGGALPTKIVFNKNPLVSMEGNTKELGYVVSKYEEVFELTVKYFEGKVDFVQIVKLKANVKTNLTGSIEFMLCNDEQCLPPTTVKFSVRLE